MNTSVGYQTLYSVTTGNWNKVGSQAGYSLVDGQRNVFIGGNNGAVI